MAPNPRNALDGTLLVNTALEVMLAFGTRYGPDAQAAAANRTRGDRLGYAPASPRISTCCAVSVPSPLAPVRYRMTNGCRLVLAVSDSCRSQIIRTGRRVCQTSSAR